MIGTLLTNIKSEITQRCDGVRICHVYPAPRCDIVAPAVFLEAASYNAGDDPATSELSCRAPVKLYQLEARNL